MIKIRGLSKKYGTGEAACIALNNVNVDLPDNQFIAITGKSGSGKTTLLNMIRLIDKPDCGMIEVDGKDILQFKRKEILKYRRETVGIIFQFFQLIPVLNCFDNIVIANEFSKKYEEHYFEDLINRLNIHNILNKYPEQLSGGEQQRVAIARALINRPEIVLADEPTGNLDSENSANVVSLLKDIVRQYNMSLIMVTHDVDIAKQADINICLQDGKMGRYS